jgi:hypothetical protein
LRVATDTDLCVCVVCVVCLSHTQHQNQFNTLQAITVPEKNFTVLRDRMSTSAPPKIPYIGTSLADLTFIEDGNPDFHDGLINFTKRHLLFGAPASLSPLPSH